jgi:cupin 2 domain-containing protein
VKAQNIFSSIIKDLDQELFDDLLEQDNVKIQRIVSTGQVSESWYDQDFNEWVMVLKGAAVICFEDEQPIQLQEGSYINIPAHKIHCVSWTSLQSETVWLAVHY